MTSGYIGYILSTLEVCFNYLKDPTRREALVELGRENGRLWTLINEVQPDRRLARFEKKIEIKERNEVVLRRVDECLKALHSTWDLSGEYWMCPLFSRNTKGETYLAVALKRMNRELMQLIFESDTLVTIEDLLEEVDVKRRSIFVLALDLNHSFTEELIQMLLLNDLTPSELTRLNRRVDYKGRTIGHLITCLNNWDMPQMDKLLKMIDWSIKDDKGFTPSFPCSEAMTISNMRTLFVE